jgi:hypothetical protein
MITGNRSLTKTIYLRREAFRDDENASEGIIEINRSKMGDRISNNTFEIVLRAILHHPSAVAAGRACTRSDTPYPGSSLFGTKPKT